MYFFNLESYYKRNRDIKKIKKQKSSLTLRGLSNQPISIISDGIPPRTRTFFLDCQIRTLPRKRSLHHLQIAFGPNSRYLINLDLHSKNIIHRDVKPENIVFVRKNVLNVKLLDFGLSEYVQDQEILFKRSGTPGYVAPEILLDKPYNNQSDMFSLGVILY